MKNIITIVAILIFTSCSNKPSESTGTTSVAVSKMEVKSEFSNPSFMNGSTFGEFFLSTIRTQNIDLAVKFTSSGSIEKFGLDKIREKYETYNFNYKLSLKSIKQNADTFFLLYTTNEYATGKLKRMTVVLENDSCKLVLPDNIDELLK